MKLNNMFSIKNKIIIVTGGGGTGMANHLAKSMAIEGAFVYAVDIKSQKHIQKKLNILIILSVI